MKNPKKDKEKTSSQVLIAVADRNSEEPQGNLACTPPSSSTM